MESRYHKSAENKILCVSFKDKKAKKPVSLASTSATVESVEVRGRSKPAAIHIYNQLMNGCDRADQNLGYYGVQDSKSHKWWKKLFFWATEVVQLNAFILYKIQNNAAVAENPRSRANTFKGFKEAVMKGLVELYAAETGVGNIHTPPEAGLALPGRPREEFVLEVERYSHKRHIIKYTPYDHRCKYCPKRTGLFAKTAKISLT
ncbi:PiggyBac transposable element-derived protein 4-like [Plakobranchus ocellatus]|uniref:PiggyBac transposable element-derived protein 4-like n=1 Tax=Plakobranchus ocellatus TaxID=259542 RepID=A0AAV4D2E1_9GAST|nr:PiggyBac transposable element-derived protein 4-like [Plakobranchus ocellatus]